MSLHIHSGDSSAEIVSKVIPGQHLAWTDNLFEGPLPKADWNDLTWFEARSAALADYLGGKEIASQKLASRYYVIREALNCECEVTLWFDSCMYDMMLLCQFLAFTKSIIREDSVVYLVCEELRDDGSRFAGYGELNEDEIQSMMKRRKLVTPAMREDAVKAWEAFTSPDPHAWQEAAKDSYELTPFLAPAFERLLEQLPNDLGFNRLEMEIMFSIMDGCSEPMPMFEHVSEQEERPYFGDTVFYKALNRLATARQPLIRFYGPGKVLPQEAFAVSGNSAFKPEDWKVTMTLAGMRAVWNVGQGKGGFYDDIRWLANVKLSPDDDWRYDPKQKKLYKRQ